MIKAQEEIIYLTEYCNLRCEWDRNGIDIDNASESQTEYVTELKKRAMEQSGLSCNELTLIFLCRKYGIFKKVNVYARKLI